MKKLIALGVAKFIDDFPMKYDVIMKYDDGTTVRKIVNQQTYTNLYMSLIPDHCKKNFGNPFVIKWAYTMH